MKKLLLSAAAFAVVAVSAVAVAPTTAEAVPAFARQTGAACYSCHFQAIPRLTAFGRNFRMNAFRDMGEQALIEDDHLSLPAVFNAALLFKARIKDQNGDAALTGGAFGTGKNTAIQWPDETAILIGGRYGEHVGGLTEWAGGGPLSYKLAYVFDTDMGSIAIAGGSTDGLGAPYLFNDPSNTTGRNIRGWQHRAAFSDAAHILSDGVSGIGVYAYLNDMAYIAIGGIIPNLGALSGNTTSATNAAALDLSLYARIAATVEFGGFDVVGGVYYADINLKAPNAVALGALDPTGGGAGQNIGVDLQVQGDIGDASLGFYLLAQFKGEDPFLSTPLAKVDNTGYYPLVTVAFGHFGVRFGYDYSKVEVSGGPVAVSSTAKTLVAGAWYSVAQNVELDLEYNSTKFGVPAGLPAVASANSTTLVLEYVY
ncbi:MAG: hypothetical protein ACE5F3_00255 [Mariprofundaceae bacterium]